jgi:hypothetical protein
VSLGNPLRWADYLATGTAHAIAGDYTQARLAFFRAWPDAELPPLRALGERVAAIERGDEGARDALVAEVTAQVKTMTEILDALEMGLRNAIPGADPDADDDEPHVEIAVSPFAALHSAMVESARDGWALGWENEPGEDDDERRLDRAELPAGDDAEIAARERAAFGIGNDDPEIAARERAAFEPDPYGRGPIDRDRDGRPDADRFE